MQSAWRDPRASGRHARHVAPIANDQSRHSKACATLSCMQPARQVHRDSDTHSHTMSRTWGKRIAHFGTGLKTPSTPHRRLLIGQQPNPHAPRWHPFLFAQLCLLLDEDKTLARAQP